MKEQVVTQRVGSRSGGGGSKARSSGQRPAKRDRDPSLPIAARLRSFISYVPTILKVGSAVFVLALAFLAYRAAASASFFEIRNVEAKGLNRVSKQSIEATVRQQVAATGVWRADLESLGAHLERLPWVRRAVVTRVLPDGIRVRVTERQPRVVIRTGAGRFMWVDEDGVVLNEMASTDPMPAFFLRGWNEEGSKDAQEENRQRVARFLELQETWNAEGLSERVSEVNMLDSRDVRAQLSGDDSQIEIRLGSQDQAKRLKPALDALDRLRQTPRGPYISYLDVNQGKRIIVGLVSGSHAPVDASDAADVPDEAKPALASDRQPSDRPDAARKPREKESKTVKDTKAVKPARKVEQKRT